MFRRGREKLDNPCNSQTSLQRLPWGKGPLWGGRGVMVPVFTGATTFVY